MEHQAISEVFNINEEKKKKITSQVKNFLNLKKLLEGLFEEPISEFLETLFVGAIILEASDVHVEPQENRARIRLRIDGILQDLLFINLEIYKRLCSRIKLLSGLKLNVEDRPQDGRFSIVFSDSEKVEVRTSTLPSEQGEFLVLRLLNPKNLIEVEELGLREDLLKIFKEEIRKPFGMIVVTGPTGSGKTTTLYACLKKIQNPGIKIITIEDPIEYRLKGISQTQVDPQKGYDFARGLRALMRQDPDVILVGEIRDPDTAKIAVQAALTGHLVLTTLHTNDASGAIPRFIDLGVRPISLAPALRMVIAQRLVRKVCKHCAQKKKLSKEEVVLFKKELSDLKIKIPKISSKTQILKSKGCPECNFTGYRRRIGIFEALLVDDDIESLILKNSSSLEIKKTAIKKGMVTLYQDGLLKVLSQITTLEEVNRVAAED